MDRGKRQRHRQLLALSEMQLLSGVAGIRQRQREPEEARIRPRSAQSKEAMRKCKAQE